MTFFQKGQQDTPGLLGKIISIVTYLNGYLTSSTYISKKLSKKGSLHDYLLRRKVVAFMCIHSKGCYGSNILDKVVTNY